MKEKTLFEKIVSRDISADIIYEDEKYLAFLDIFPFERGHTLVIPKKAYETIFDMPEDEFLELQNIVLKVANKIHDKLGGGLNILQNNYKISGQIIPHVHFHLIPRNLKKELYCHGKEEYSHSEKEDILEKLKF